LLGFVDVLLMGCAVVLCDVVKSVVEGEGWGGRERSGWGGRKGKYINTHHDEDFEGWRRGL